MEMLLQRLVFCFRLLILAFPCCKGRFKVQILQIIDGLMHAGEAKTIIFGDDAGRRCANFGCGASRRSFPDNGNRHCLRIDQT